MQNFGYIKAVFCRVPSGFFPDRIHRVPSRKRQGLPQMLVTYDGSWWLLCTIKHAQTSCLLAACHLGGRHAWEEGSWGPGEPEHSCCLVSSSLKLHMHPGKICVGMELAHIYGPASAGQQLILLCMHGKDLSLCSNHVWKVHSVLHPSILGQMWGHSSSLDALLTIFLTELFTLITWQSSAVFLGSGKVGIFH